MFPFSRCDLQIPKWWLSGSQYVKVAFHSAHKGGLNQVFCFEGNSYITLLFSFALSANARVILKALW